MCVRKERHVKKKRVLSLFCILCLLSSLPSCKKGSLAKQTTLRTEEFNVEIVYKQNQYCYAVASDGNNPTIYTFNAAGLPVYAEDGTNVTSAALTPGMKVAVSYDGYVLETYPAQFSGVAEVKINGSRPNNVDFIAKQLSGLFPSTSPEEVMNWDVFFSGVTYLTENEKRALEFILREKWTNATVTIDPSSETEEESGSILIQVDNVTESTLDLIISVNIGSTEKITRNVHAVLENGCWKMKN